MVQKKNTIRAIILLGLVLGGLYGLSNLAVYPWSQEMQVVEAGSTTDPYTWSVLDDEDKSTEIGYFFINNERYNSDAVQYAIKQIGRLDTGYGACGLMCHSIWDMTETDVLGFGFNAYLKTLRDASMSSGYGSEDAYRWHGDIRETSTATRWGNKRIEGLRVPTRFPNEIGWLVYYRCDMGYRGESVLRQERLACDIYQEKIRIYPNCGDRINLLSYLPDNEKLEFLNEFGDGEICRSKTYREGSTCETVADCHGLAITTTYLGDIENANVYISKVPRCERENPSDPTIKFVNRHTSVGQKLGTCEVGVKYVDDCYKAVSNGIIPPATAFRVRTVDDGYYQSFSGWGVKDGSCVLGQCRSYSGCYDLYNSILYECVPVMLDYEDPQNFIGKCEFKMQTTGTIEKRCTEQANRGKIDQLKSGYSWAINEITGECEQSAKQIDDYNTCTKLGDCDCPPGKIAHCAMVEGTGKGVCYCLNYIPPTTIPTTTIIGTTTTTEDIFDIDIEGGMLIWYIVAGLMLLVGVGLLFKEVGK